MAYAIEALPSAARELEAVPRDAQRRIARKIDALAENPRPPGVEKLQGGSDLLRVRAGHYRVVYHVDDERKVVTLVRVGHRSEVYRRPLR